MGLQKFQKGEGNQGHSVLAAGAVGLKVAVGTVQKTELSSASLACPVSVLTGKSQLCRTFCSITFSLVSNSAHPQVWREAP